MAKGDSPPPAAASPSPDGLGDIARWTKAALHHFDHARRHGDSVIPTFFHFGASELLMRSRQGVSDTAALRRTWRMSLFEQEPQAATSVRRSFDTDPSCLVIAAMSPNGPFLIDLIAAGTTTLIGADVRIGPLLNRWVGEALTGEFGGKSDVIVVGAALRHLHFDSSLTHVATLAEMLLHPSFLAHVRRSDRGDSSIGSALLVIVHNALNHERGGLSSVMALANERVDIGVVVVGPSENSQLVVMIGSNDLMTSIYEPHHVGEDPVVVAPRIETAEMTKHSSATHVRVDVLGPIRIHNTEGRIAHRPKLMELVVYLALHRGGATTRAWSNALWPDRIVPGQTIANRLSEARRELGFASDGKPRLRRHGERHHIAEVVSDWEEFCFFTGPGSKPNSWRKALLLVRGRPFEGLRQDQWIVLEGFLGEIELRVLDCAMTYGEQMLRDGYPEEAAWGAQMGLRANPWEERCHRLLMRAADAAGNRAGIEKALRDLAAVMEIDGDPLTGVHPETASLYVRLTASYGSPAPEQEDEVAEQ